MILALVIAIALLGIWSVAAIGYLLVKNFQFRELLNERDEIVATLRAALQRPAVAMFTVEQISELAKLLKDPATKNWVN